MISGLYEWEGDIRLVIPAGDEPPCEGNPGGAGGVCEVDPPNTKDADAITNAMTLADANNVGVIAITGLGSPPCVIGLADDITDGTVGGQAFHRTAFTSYELLGEALLAKVQTIVNELPPCLVCDADCPEDLNGNGVVNVFDLLVLLGAWGECSRCPADLDGSGVVNVFDLLILLGAWGPCPQGGSGGSDPVPESIQDCLDDFWDHGSIQKLEECLDWVAEREGYLDSEG